MTMNYYMGVKLIQAKPENRNGEEGYFVRYPDGYESWSPAAQFEAAYLELGPEEPNGVTPSMMTGIVEGCERDTMGVHVVVRTQLRTGYSIITDAACVDPENFDIQVGSEIALTKMRNELMPYLGFTLAWAKNGLAPAITEEQVRAAN